MSAFEKSNFPASSTGYALALEADVLAERAGARERIQLAAPEIALVQHA
jgi:hypothetical protein